MKTDDINRENALGHARADADSLRPKHTPALVKALGDEIERLRAINADLLGALEKIAIEYHKDAYPINNLHALAFEDCRAPRCVQARAAIKKARCRP